MDKRYQVFVSSTYEDLREERREVMQALLALDCIPTGMELFPAADDDSWTHIQQFIAGCDYYVVIVGGRYGSKGPKGKSYTEMEYDYAVEAGVPALAFLHKDPGAIPANKTESTDDGKVALDAFKEKIKSTRHAKFWSSSGELAGMVALSLASLTKSKPRVGWVRANLVPDETAAQEILKLKRKIEELETKIAESGFSPPEGSRELAQGEEMISVHFGHETTSGYRDDEEGFSWNGILAILGPILIGHATETQLKEKLVGSIVNRYKDKKRVQIYGAHCRDEDFQKIKVQLRALGLIRELYVEGEKGKMYTAWTLTPYGDRLMTQVAAIRSSANA